MWFKVSHRSLFIPTVGLGDVYTCSATMSQGKRGQVEAIVPTDCRHHSSNDCKAAGSVCDLHLLLIVA